MKIIVVDDNKESCETLAALFQAMHHKAEASFDGPSAIRRTLEWLPDLLLLDIGMPDMDGWQVATVLRKEPTLIALKIYALTGYGDQSDIQRSFDVGMNYHFVKPLDIDDFWAVLQKQGVFCNN